MMRKVLLILLAVSLCFVFVTPTLADEFGFGGAYIDGHSDTGKYGMNNEGSQSWGGALHYDRDKDWRKTFGNNAIGIDPGMVYIYARWTKNNNEKRTIKEEFDYCRGDECEPQYYTTDSQEWPTRTRTEEYTDSEHVNSHILGMYLKPYLEVHKKVRLFGLAGPGLEIADDGTNPAAIFGGGIQYRFNKRFATSLTQYEVFADPFSEYRRFDVTVLSIDFLF